MKKQMIALVLAVAALAVFTTGVVFAQAPQPAGAGSGYGMGRRGTADGPLHTYMVNALAKALGITPTDFEARRDAGQTAYQIALSLGISADKIPALIANARTEAINAALADKVITQQQADWMKSRATAMGTGVCDGTGPHSGAGMMMGRGPRWQQTNP